MTTTKPLRDALRQGLEEGPLPLFSGEVWCAVFAEQDGTEGAPHLETMSYHEEGAREAAARIKHRRNLGRLIAVRRYVLAEFNAWAEPATR